MMKGGKKEIMDVGVDNFVDVCRYKFVDVCIKCFFFTR